MEGLKNLPSLTELDLSANYGDSYHVTDAGLGVLKHLFLLTSFIAWQVAEMTSQTRVWSSASPCVPSPPSTSGDFAKRSRTRGSMSSSTSLPSRSSTGTLRQ